MEDIYKLQATYFANVLYQQTGVVACVHLENNDDIMFWDSILQSKCPGHYYFITHSRSSKGIETSGSKQCLNYKSYLSKRFFIGIDSDLRYLLKEPKIDATHFICQTYTYSWENHYCEANALQERFQEKCPEKAKSFNFIEFLTAYSNAVYKPLLLLLHCIKNNKYDFTQRMFSNCLPKQCRFEELANNGKPLIERINKLFELHLNSKFAKEVNLDKEADAFSSINVTKQNAYLHIKGHNLFDLICYIGDLLCHRTNVSFKNDVLTRSLPPQNYWQLKKVGHDIIQILLHND